MGAREIGYRAKQHLRALAERSGLTAVRVPTRRCETSGAPWVAVLPRQFDTAKYSRAADRILAGEFDVFAMRPVRLGFPPRWNQDPKTGRVAPLEFGKTLDYRDERKVGDIKYLWEPSRHAELITLAQAWHLTQHPRYAQGCRTLLDSWIEQCPWPLGVHWTSSLEHAVRLIHWSFAWHLLGGDQAPLFETPAGQSFKERWLTSVFQHCRFIAEHFSRHSSANNHLLGELTGLFVATTTWPLWQQSQAWSTAAQRELEQQALLQNGADGVNREQAAWYHHEVADMLLLAAVVGRANGREFSAAFWQRLEAMLEFIASIMDVAGNVPAFGDSDDAIIARLDPAPDVHVYRSLLASGAVLFGRSEFMHKAGRFDDKSRWLLGDDAAAQFAALSAPLTPGPPRREFPNAGYYILGSDFETADEVRIVADAGPLGYLSIAAHGHADALSFTLSASGQELLIDPGTFAYHTQRQWRDYFRGTAAHNTVRVDGQDQSVGAGNFLWLAHARARATQFETTPQVDRLLAEHDGYRRLRDPVLHRRELRLDHATATLTVTDELLCQRSHQVEIFWHFAPNCSVTHTDSRVVAAADRTALTLELPHTLACELIRGRETPPLGWVSPRFDTRMPSHTLVGRAAIRGNTRFVTQMKVSRAAAQSAVSGSALQDRNFAGTDGGRQLRQNAAG
jgi:uncharacterized heparinase superfamily protein